MKVSEGAILHDDPVFRKDQYSAFPVTLMYAHITKTGRKKITITNQNQRLTTAKSNHQRTDYTCHEDLIVSPNDRFEISTFYCHY